MIFLPQGVIILQHEIFTPQHGGKYYYSIKYLLFLWGWEYYTIKYIPFPLGENIMFSNIHSLSWDENRKVLNMYSFGLIIKK